jgi:hypothetical protein
MSADCVVSAGSGQKGDHGEGRRPAGLLCPGEGGLQAHRREAVGRSASPRLAAVSPSGVRLAHNNSAGPLNPDKAYELTYKIRGGEDPLTNALEITGDYYSTDQEDFIGTSSSSAKLTAVVTDVQQQ